MKITLYPEDFAFISRPIIIDLNEGLNEIVIDNIPPTIDTKSVIFSFNDETIAKVQEYEFITNEDTKEFYLRVMIDCVQTGSYEAIIFYKVYKVHYEIFYNFLYNAEQETIKIQGWLKIENMSGFSYDDIETQVVVKEQQDNIIFTLDTNCYMPHGKIVNTSFLSQDNIPVKTKMIVPCDKEIVIEAIYFYNNENNGLGTPLMAGDVAIYFKDTDDCLQHLGDDSIPIYLPDEEITFEISQSTDTINVQRKRLQENNYSVTLENTTDNILEVRLECNTYGQNILQTTAAFTVDDDGIASVDLKLIPHAPTQLFYKLQGIEPPTGF